MTHLPRAALALSLALILPLGACSKVEEDDSAAQGEDVSRTPVALAFAKLAAGLADMHYAVEHKHIGFG